MSKNDWRDLWLTLAAWAVYGVICYVVISIATEDRRPPDWLWHQSDSATTQAAGL